MFLQSLYAILRTSRRISAGWTTFQGGQNHLIKANEKNKWKNENSFDNLNLKIKRHISK